jgi:hypothetical protein
MIVCNIKGEIKLGSNDKGETFIWWTDGNKWLTLDEFEKCSIEPGTKFVLRIQNEITHKVNKNVSSYNDPVSFPSFNSNNNYSLSPSPLKIQNVELKNEIRQEPKHETIPSTNNNITSISDLFVGGAAAIAMALSVAQQIRQKKNEAEASMCCNNNKIEISKFDTKIQKLETEIKAKSEKENKGMIAEILETRKEIKDIKEEFENSQDNLKKLIEIIDMQRKNKK